jgi:lysophospholipase L1-like esterase
MARTHQSRIGRTACAGILSLLLAGTVAAAQDNAPAQPAAPAQPDAPAPAPAPASPPAQAVMPAPFSRDCQIGGTDIVNESPLPSVAAALKDRRQLRILAIGAAALGRRFSRGGHTEDIRQILQKAIKGLDVMMINRGVSGELAAQAAIRIQTEVALTEPDLVLWQVGTNDALAYVPLDELKSSLVDTVRWLRGHKVDVVLVGLQYVDRMEQDDHYKAVRELLRKIAAEENVMIVRRYEAQRLLSQAAASGGGLIPDEFQRSEAGYACLAQYMARAITLGIFGNDPRLRQPLRTPPNPPPN